MNDNQYVRRPLTVDELDPESRAFYERALWKRCLSFFFIALVSLKAISPALCLSSLQPFFELD